MLTFEKRFLSIFSIATVLIQRIIHRNNDDIYALALSVSELLSVRENLHRISTNTQDDMVVVQHRSKEYDLSLHTCSRMCQQLDDCVERLQLIEQHLRNDKKITSLTIEKLDNTLKSFVLL